MSSCSQTWCEGLGLRSCYMLQLSTGLSSLTPPCCGFHAEDLTCLSVSVCLFRSVMSLMQTAFSDFLMRSSKDLSKHIKVVVSSCPSNSQWFRWKHGVTPSPSSCHCLCPQCDGTDLTSKVQDLKLQCLVFLNIPRLVSVLFLVKPSLKLMTQQKRLIC